MSKLSSKCVVHPSLVGPCVANDLKAVRMLIEFLNVFAGGKKLCQSNADLLECDFSPHIIVVK